jgi:colanic acid biosynthesis glycosyl transferase WcaI
MNPLISSQSIRPIRVLVITPHYAPDFGPSSPIFTALCEGLQRAGYEVTVAAGFPHFGGASELFHYPNRFYIEERINGVRVIRTYVYKIPKSALWRRLIYHVSYNLSSAFAVLRAGQTDIILADGPSLWSGLPLLVKALLPGKPFIYIIHDLYPEVLVKLNVIHNQNLINFIEHVERFFYDRSVQISVLSQGFKDILLQKGISDAKVTIIPVCVDIEFFNPDICKKELSEQWGVADKFVVLYAGNIGFSQGLENVVEAARQMVDYPDIVFVIVGEGATKPELQALVEKYKLPNIRFFPFQRREMTPQIYALADVGLVSLKSEIVLESVPSKTFTIMASGRPIIATVDPSTEVGLLLKQANCGLWVKPENAPALANAIYQLYADRELCRQMGKSGRDYVVLHHCKQVATDHYRGLIQKFVKAI